MQITSETIKQRAFCKPDDRPDDKRAFQFFQRIRDNTAASSVLIDALVDDDLRHMTEAVIMTVKVWCHYDKWKDTIESFDDFKDVLDEVDDEHYRLIDGLRTPAIDDTVDRGLT